MSAPFPYNSDDLLKFVNGEEPIPARIQKIIVAYGDKGKEYVLKLLYDTYVMRENNAREQEEKRRVYRKKYRETNKERIKQYRENNRDILNEKARLYHEKNKDTRHAYNKQYIMNNQEKEKKRHDKYYEEHKEQELIKSRKYREANRDRILKANKIKMQCECGTVIAKNEKSRHYKTKAHLRTIEDFKKISDDVNEYLLSM